jgi:hypothetical protein
MRIKAIMLVDVKLASTRLALHNGDIVVALPASNQPDTSQYFVSPWSGEWDEDSILVSKEDIKIIYRR